jgi:transketolase
VTIPSRDFDELDLLSRRGRWLVFKTVGESGAGHIGAPLSVMDILVALYFRVMNVRPDNPKWADRDRLILSKGHAAIGLYTVLALRGYLPVDELKTFDKAESRLQGHPDMLKLPGLDASTGSLGQGLSVGIGMAIGARLRREAFHTFVVLGDGEMQEGMAWEAAHIAPRYKLGNLTAVVDMNGLQQFGWPLAPGERSYGDRRDPWMGIDLVGVFERLGWRVLEADGHDFAKLIPTLQQARNLGPSDRPTLILAHTVKGKGVSLTEGKFEWHARVPTSEELGAVAAELGVEPSVV